MGKHLLLAIDFAKRDFIERYVGTGLGKFWYLLSPLVMIFIYTVIFSDFMKMRLDIIDNSYAYSIYLVPGLLAWGSFSTALMRLNTAFFDRAGFIKKISVPPYVFLLAIIFTELFTFAISMLLGIGFLLLVGHTVDASFLWLFVLMGLQGLFALGLGTLFGLFAPFFKDLKEIVPIILQLWFWVTPIIYVKSMLEHKYPLLLELNPFFYFVDSYQNIFLFAKPPSLQVLLVLVAQSIAALGLAAWLYKKMVPAIKDII